ncbi:MAG: 50S ribosomal protein L10 [Candidatus Thermofonsia bacterium]|nr:MAG: 50S ribosomal protein L10 [Candidatus Thermofonsia bacterium]
MRIFYFCQKGGDSLLAISRKRKEELVDMYVDLINNSRAIYWTEYTGLSVKQLNELRTKVIEANGAFHVTKNTLLVYALKQAGRPVPEELLKGQLATGFALQEAPSVAKALVNFAKDEDKLHVRGGMLNDEMLSIEQVEALAKMPSLDELRGQLVGLISAPARNVASVVASGVRQVVNVLDAYAKKDEAAEAA